MKKIILLFALIIYSSLSLIAQNVPQGMNYQAVARNLQGQTLANQEISLRINLRSDGPDGKIVYTEIHQATTNDLGLFALIIGEGTKSKKLGTAFDAVPWSEAEIWMELAIDEQGGDNFQVLNVSRLMSVPYAFHAGTASRIKDLSFDKWMTEFNDREKRGGSTGIPFWTVWGNSNVDTNYHWMGTSVAQDVIFKGNNIEAIRIKTDGSVNISGPSTFGDDLFVRRNLTVGQNTTLRGMLGVQGSTTLAGTLDVTEAATLKDNLTVKENTILEGTLDVTGAATLKDNLTVKENTILEGTLDVTEAATLKDNLTVKENTILEGTLDVTEAATLKDNLTVKENTILEGTLDVTEAATLKDNLTVKENTILEGTLDVTEAATLKDNLTVKENTILEGTLDVTEAATLKDNLTVKENTILEGTLDVTEAATLKDNLTVKENTILEGTLDVTEAATLKDNLTVKENSILEGTLDVTEAATLKDNLTVKENTILEGTLDVTEAATLKDKLTVEGETTLKDKLTISNNIPGDFVFSIENTNGEDGSNAGDGMRIKLGKTNPAWDGSGFLNVPNPAAEFFDGSIGTVRGWVEGEPFEVTELLNFVPVALIAGTACRFTQEFVLDKINDGLSLPLTTRDILIGINGGPPSDGACDGAGDCFIPDNIIPDVGATIIPQLELPCDALPSFSPPNINFVNVNNSLTKENQFISFVDKDDRELGAIKAMSVTEWGEDYFDGVRFVNFMGSAGKLDPLGAITGVVRELTAVADSYNSLGVEYSSGHGDYAEWLERQDPNEVISRGDIIAVVGGKITKDLAGAEQVMAVSEHPIVLGNMPPEGKTHLGNNVAFMGQIPVKVMGPVASGDYIVANEKIPGYGVAIHPADIKVEHTPYIVGRSWESRSGAGPKMVNTVIGVHNGDYFRILQKYEQKFKDSEARFDILESKVDRLLERVAPESN